MVAGDWFAPTYLFSPIRLLYRNNSCHKHININDTILMW